MSKSKGSLARWLILLIVVGTMILSIIYFNLSMAFYVQSIHSVLTHSMQQCSKAVIGMVGKEKLLELCQEELDSDGAMMDVSNKKYEDVLNALVTVKDVEDASRLTLYACNKEEKQGRVVVDTGSLEENVDKLEVITKDMIHQIIDNEEGIHLLREKDGWKEIALIALSDERDELFGILRVSFSVRELIESRKRYMGIYTAIFFIMTFILSFIAIRMLNRRVKNPLERLTAAAIRYKEVEVKDILKESKHFFDVPSGLYEDEIYTLWETCSEMEKSIDHSIRELHVMTKKEEKEKAELKVAANIQKGMMPRLKPTFKSEKRLSIEGVMMPARGVGGDFFDAFKIDDDHVAIAIGDVSGKGIPAALFMTMCMTLLRTHIRKGKRPSEILSTINDIISYYNPQVMFVTVWLGILDLSNGSLEISSAGHDYPAISQNNGDFKIHECENGMAIGFMESFVYPQETLKLSPGDRVFLYTDGVPESCSGETLFLGIDRMIDILNAHKNEPEKIFLKRIREGVDDFVQDNPQFDDLTMLTFTYLGEDNLTAIHEVTQKKE